jgi:hypothetical protein
MAACGRNVYIATAEILDVVGADALLFIDRDQSAQTSGIMLKRNLSP